MFFLLRINQAIGIDRAVQRRNEGHTEKRYEQIEWNFRERKLIELGHNDSIERVNNVIVFILLRGQLKYKGERMFNERKEADKCTRERKEK